ncbi:hypothetical protein GCM10022416_59560 [Actinomadura keratinilytica]|uniref:Uncharacterized protein n=1 Tax=Actinomadura keratinilytica TaxID=547461 RepID=A0ABP7ZI39_9ACTN
MAAARPLPSAPPPTPTAAPAGGRQQAPRARHQTAGRPEARPVARPSQDYPATSQIPYLSSAWEITDETLSDRRHRVPTLPVGLIQGDAHTNDLIRTKQGQALLGDWDHVLWGRGSKI